MTIRYTPGDWYAVVTPAGVALLPPHLAPEVIEAVWDRLASGKGLGGVLEALTGAFGTSLSAIPPFAVVVSGATPVRLAVRGELDVRVTTTRGETSVISGLGVTTWSERLFDDAAAVDILRHGAEPPRRSLPLSDGIALGSGIALVLGEAVATSIDAISAAVSAGSLVRDDSEPADAPVPPVDPVLDADSVTAQPEPEPPQPEPPQPEPEPELDPPPASTEPEHDEPSADEPEEVTTEQDVPHSDDTWMPQTDTYSGSTVDPVDEDSASDPDPAAAEEVGAPDPDHAIAKEHPPVDDSYDHLWDATVAKSIEDAAVRPDIEPETDSTIAQPPSAPSGEGDHDGETISWAQAQQLREPLAAAMPAPSATTAPSAPATRTGAIELSDGQRATLDRPVVIGRRPRAVRVTGALPHLIAVDSPEQDISRSHVEIRREGDVTLVVDLDTTNGTILLREGSEPMRLHPGEAMIVIETDVIDLGDGIHVTFKDLG